MKLLVAEDDPVSRKLVEHSLKLWGHQVVSVSDGKAALKAWEGGAFDALITDWMMPEMDGIELVHKIRAIHANRYAWVIMLTAKSSHDDFQAAMSAGVDDFLLKPLDRELMRVRLEVGARVMGIKQKLGEITALLPICMHCKSVRDEATQWRRIEEYLAEAGTDLSHGFCPDCFYRESVQPEIKRLQARHPAPLRAAGPESVDSSALSWLRNYEDESPGLADELLQCFQEGLIGVRRTLTRGTVNERVRTNLRQFAACASDVGATVLSERLKHFAERPTGDESALALAALDEVSQSFAANRATPG